MEKKFDIPTLNQEDWDGVQASLDSIGRIISDLRNTELNPQRLKELDLVSIHLGMIDIYLGRHYTLDEVSKKLKEDVKENDVKHTDAWVMQPYNICITTCPPKYLTTIFHYHDQEGLFEPALQRGSNTKIFYTKDEAINYCKLSLGCEYEIVDIPTSCKVVFGDDYE